MTDTKTKRQAKRLRTFRKIHRFMGACLFIFFFVLSISGLLLGWKKNSQGMILPKSYQGISTNYEDWKSLDELHKNAVKIAHTQIDPNLSLELERIDVRPNNGMVKFVFAQDYWGIQLDLTTGKLLHIERRKSDFVENIHDGSILDYIFGTDGEYLKLVYTSIMGLSLLTFTVTGFWLWFGPKLLRKERDLQQLRETKI